MTACTVSSPTDATAQIAGLLHQRTGQNLSTSRAWRIDTALQPLLRDRHLASLDELAAALRVDATGRLASATIDLLLNQETSFYRDAGVIDLAVDALLARRVANPERRPRVWSAGCSVGQEPYSLAMLFAERVGREDEAALPDIVATDVSEGAIARARAGRYNQFEIQRGLPIRRMLKWFEEVDDAWVATPALTRLVSFRRHNLTTEPAPYGLFDVILCRNVMLYFEPAMRRAMFDRLADALRPGGLLILGAGETTIGQTERFAPSRDYRGGYDLAALPEAVQRRA